MNLDLENLVRENIQRLVPYSSARGEFSGSAGIFLDANENRFGSPLAEDYSRYPDPLQRSIKQRIAATKGLRTSEIFLGNGSDEAIDLLFRVFCDPGKDSAVICPPTYGMYEVAANINDVRVRRANLTSGFELDIAAIRRATFDDTKIIFICSPNNPTGNVMERSAILHIAAAFNGIVVVDEAYIDFACEVSLVSEINTCPNLVVLQTFSKAWGLAGLRVGLAFANAEIIALLNKVKPPYNVSQVAQEMILKALGRQSEVEETILRVVAERTALTERLQALAVVKKIYPSDANFILVRMRNANEIYRFLLREQIVVRNRSTVELCEGCLRITIGTPQENQSLIEALEKYEKSIVY